MQRRDFLYRMLASTVAASAAGKDRKGSRVASSAKSTDPLAEQVTIYCDEYGVPHILGETEEATFFGYGYAQAQDHLETMMMHYLDAQGRLAEVRGLTRWVRGTCTTPVLPNPTSTVGTETTCNGCCAPRRPWSRTRTRSPLKLTKS